MSNLEEKESPVDSLAKDLNNLSVVKELDSEEEEISNRKEIDTDDDGYDSSISEEKLDFDDEKILEPLSIIPGPKPVVHILYNARGVSDFRYNPYSRPQSSRNIPQIVEPGQEENKNLFKPTVRILKKSDTKNPCKLDVTVEWTNTHEICIGRCQLPEQTYYGDPAVANKVQLFIQINPNVKELKSFMADVRTEFLSNKESRKHFIGPIVIYLKTELAESQEKFLLEKTTMEERTDAYNLVEKKDLNQLTSGIGPHKDTVLSVLCAQKNPKNPGQTFAQIYAVIQRLINHPEKKVKETIFRSNNNQISAFEISVITNNSAVACYLAEIMYNLTDDVETALHILSCRDTQGNSIIHLLARKGDSNKETLKSLMDLRLSDGSKIFESLANSKKQFPMHIAAQSLTNQPETIRILYESMKKSFEVMDSDGMTALHYACQRSMDVELVRTILSYKKDNINVINKDGLSALDLISQRSPSTNQSQGPFAIEKSKQEEITKLMMNNGGSSGKHAINEYFPSVASEYPGQNMGYLMSGSSPSPPSACSVSPMGSPCSLQNSVGSPVNISDPFLNSVDSNQQSSPESVNLGSPHSLLSTHTQGSPYNNPESPSNYQSYEDQIASEILTQFPEITDVLGQLFNEEH